MGLEYCVYWIKREEGTLTTPGHLHQPPPPSPPPAAASAHLGRLDIFRLGTPFTARRHRR